MKLRLLIFSIIIWQLPILLQAQTFNWKQACSQPEQWYESAEAMRIAENILMFQNNNGGWAKNFDFTGNYNPKIISKWKEENYEHINYTTIDNGATHTEINYLIKVYEATGNEKYKDALLKGIDYLLEAQYDNGGWPQFYPLRKGYYTHITFNDGAMIGVMHTLQNVADGKYKFVNKERIEASEYAIRKAVQAILKCQIKVDEELTAWCAQHNETDFLPANARAYELKSISGSESVGIVSFLMSIDQPSDSIICAVNAAIKWFNKVKLEGIRVVRFPCAESLRGYDYVLGFDPVNAKPMWARFYQIGTNYPIFVGRDGLVKYAISEIELERRVGYSWINTWPEILLEEYPKWCNKWNIHNVLEN